MGSEWVAKEPSVNSLSHRRRNFFVVRCEKKPAVLCYRWCDAAKQMGSGGVVKGYDSLSEASEVCT